MIIQSRQAGLNLNHYLSAARFAVLSYLTTESEQSYMDFLKNLIWLVFGGFLAAIGYAVGGIVLCVTVIGIPFGIQCFKLAELALWPFGKRIVNEGFNTGCLTILCNIIWLLCGGLWTAVWHVVFGILLSITVIGLPFGRKHFELAEVSMMPFGKRIEG